MMTILHICIVHRASSAHFYPANKSLRVAALQLAAPSKGRRVTCRQARDSQDRLLGVPRLRGPDGQQSAEYSRTVVPLISNCK